MYDHTPVQYMSRWNQGSCSWNRGQWSDDSMI